MPIPHDESDRTDRSGALPKQPTDKSHRSQEMVRVIRLLEYVGPRHWVETTILNNAVRGTPVFELGPGRSIAEAHTEIMAFPGRVEMPMGEYLRISDDADIEEPDSEHDRTLNRTPLLGLASTQELLEELKARGEMGSGGLDALAGLAEVANNLLGGLSRDVLEYRTVDSDG